MALAVAVNGIGVAKLVEVWTSGANLGTAVVAVIIGWVASIHERRVAHLASKVAELERQSVDDNAGVAQLRDAAVSLRARADRLDLSLAFLSDVTGRLHGDDPVAAGEAALALALARSGSRAGAVQILERGRLRTIASNGSWSADMPVPPDLLGDRTVSAAWERSGLARRSEFADAGPDDSDMVAAIHDVAGERIGVLALRGVPADSLRPAGVRDLDVIARWCGKAFSARGHIVPSALPTSEPGQVGAAPMLAAAASESQALRLLK
jgi:hypothetical protein